MSKYRTPIIIVIVLALCVSIYLYLADFSSYKSDIENSISEATGREFKISGDFQLAALPSPAIVLEDVTLQNAEWGSSPAAIEIGYLSATISLGSLLSGPVEITNLQMRDVNVLTETNEDGKSNFEFDSTSEQEEYEFEVESGGKESVFIISNGDISNVTLTRRQPGQDDKVLQLKSLIIKPDDSGEIGFDGEADISGLPVTFDGQYDASMLNVSVASGDVHAAAKTSLVDAGVGFAVTIDDLDQLGTLFGIQGLPARELTVSGIVVPKLQETELRGVSAKIGEAELNINGIINNKGKVALALDATFGDSDLNGELHVSNGDETQYEGKFTSGFLDLTPFMATEEDQAQTEDATEGETADAAPPKDEAPSREFVFVDEPFDFSGLQHSNVKLQANVDKLIANTIDIRDLVFTADVHDGNVDLDTTWSGKGDGRAGIDMLLKTKGANADLQFLSQLKNLNINVMSGDVPAENVPSTDLTIDITATGNSPRALASSANGRVLVTQGPGTIANDMIGRVSGDIIGQLFTALNPFAKNEEFSNWDCTVFSMNVTDGISEIDGLLLQGEKIQIIGAGSIDLTEEKINIEFNTKPRTGVGLTADSFVTPFVKMSGTLSKPGIGLNEKGVILSGGVAVATAGISLLVQGAADRATAQADACAAALAAAGEHAAITKQ